MWQSHLSFYFNSLGNESRSLQPDDERGNKVRAVSTAADDDKNKNMCGSMASSGICSEQRPDDKQISLCKKESEPAQTEDAAQLIISAICLVMTNEKGRQEDADM